MVVLVDTNIIIDALANREPYADNAKKILEKCAAREVTGILAAHPIRIYLTTFFPAVFPAPRVRLYALPSINGRPILPRLIITVLNIISIYLIGFQSLVS